MPQTTQHFVTDTANHHGTRRDNLKCHNQNREFQQTAYEPTKCGPLIIGYTVRPSSQSIHEQNGTFHSYCSLIGFDTVQSGKERTASIVRADAGLHIVIVRLKRDGTRTETRFRLSLKRTSPFTPAGASVQSTGGSRVVRISVSNAGNTTFRGRMRVLATHSIRQFPLHFPSRASRCAITFQTHSTTKIIIRTPNK